MLNFQLIFFQLTTSKRTYYLTSETKEDMDHWIRGRYRYPHKYQDALKLSYIPFYSHGLKSLLSWFINSVLQNVLKKQAADRILGQSRAKEVMKGWIIKVKFALQLFQVHIGNNLIVLG